MTKLQTLLLLAMSNYALVHASTQPAIPSSFILNPVHLSGETSGVFVFSTTATSSQINTFVNEVYTLNGGTSPGSCSSQFTNNRYAILFQPGAYTGTYVNVGYYTSIAGLGTGPAATIIPDVSCPQNCGTAISPGALNTFWRSAENFKTIPTTQPLGAGLEATNTMIWATSQACPLRRMYVEGSLFLFQLGLPPGESSQYESTFCSGGFMADSTITDNTVGNGTNLGGQQQFFTRNCDLGTAGSQGVWNYVYVGSNQAPPALIPAPVPCSSQSTPPFLTITTIPATPVIAEKPFISYGLSAGNPSYFLNIPQQQTNKIGTSLDSPPPSTTYIDFTQVYVATPGVDTAATINAQISAGNHILFSAGIYNLEEAITIPQDQPGLCILGIGLPTLIPTQGTPCIVVLADQVRVGGLILQAGPMTSPTLLQWGNIGDIFTEGYLYDCFTRIGRFDASNPAYNKADISVQINSANIVCDNLWLWRADHDAIDIGDTPQTGVTGGSNPSLHGLVVGQTGFPDQAKNVIAYGLASEHQLQNLVLWNGNEGQCYFYQAEYPYDAGVTFADQGYVSYLVDSDVTSHTGYGFGAYSNFYNPGVSAISGFKIPSDSNVTLYDIMTVFLNSDGGINSVVDIGGTLTGCAVATGTKGPYPIAQTTPLSPPPPPPPPATSTSTSTSTSASSASSVAVIRPLHPYGS